MKWAVFLIVLGAAALAQTDNKLAPYYPTPNTIVERMLNFAGLKAGGRQKCLPDLVG